MKSRLSVWTNTARRDKLEYEAMVKNPETAYLVSNEEFGKKLDELGISPSDLAMMAGMYVERSMYNLKKWFCNMVRELLELLSPLPPCSLTRFGHSS